MKWRMIVLLAVFVGVAAVSLSMLNDHPAGTMGAASAKQVNHGKILYGQHCASCHGVNLEGQQNWQERLPSGRLPAPPHDASGHTWHHTDQQLFEITKDGLGKFAGPDYPTDMPKFAGILTDDDIRAVLAFIKSTWPERQRATQERMTEESVQP